MSDREYTEHLTVKVEGVVMPSWLATMAAGVTVLSVLALLLLLLAFVPRLDALSARLDNRLDALSKEVRILELHVQDVESVLLRSGLAHREDFATWGPDTGPGHRAATKKGD